jgi:hypothetical protein
MTNRLQETNQPVAVQETTFSVDVMGRFIPNPRRIAASECFDKYSSAPILTEAIREARNISQRVLI